ncbi:MAG TPA: WecB/TagA/CpsF family glycosyltransferase, partial [Burkholderiaceae bacterium]|nr:WecB/TagA/CpsF family glycosyltransferase [Burkholderiaceae bacterium]
AAFDFHAGTQPRAPDWMQERGLEWAYRLVREPRRLWRRYLVSNTLFIAGAYAPPFRPLTPEEDDEIVRQINGSGAGIVFVGLGCPKQEFWMAAHRSRIRAVMVGVGAAFDFHAGIQPRAPGWMQERGLEWVYRLLREPRRLWRRYLVGNTLFILGAIGQLLSRRAKAPANGDPRSGR